MRCGTHEVNWNKGCGVISKCAEVITPSSFVKMYFLENMRRKD